MNLRKEKKLLLIGGGGHCRSVLDSILSKNYYSDIGIIDNIDSVCLGIPVIGRDSDIPKLILRGWTEAFITVGSVGDTKLRHKLYEMVKCAGMIVPTIIDPKAIVARGTEISEGAYVGKRAVVNSGSKIGICSIVNTGAIVEHDCSIGDFSHISPGATVCGQVYIDKNSHVGAGSVVLQNISIGANTMVGAGSIVVNDIPDAVKAYGNPCRVVTR